MTWLLPLDRLPPERYPLVGGKGAALAGLATGGLPVPRTICVTATAYRDFVDFSGLREKIQLELNRKIFSRMRWEELWDAAQRIRLLFAKAPMPAAMAAELRQAISYNFGLDPLAVRSSGLDEDRGSQSFAGLHASFTQVRGGDQALRRIRQVWASLWSDAALLYRQELELDTSQSAMAVLVQEMVPGEASGIHFTRSPGNAQQCVIEAVHGLNPPLVDGRISPDRWILDAENGRPLTHTPPDAREQWQPPAGGTQEDRLVSLPTPLRHRPPLTVDQLAELWRTGRRVATLAGCAQDIEWTFRDGRLVLLQARPITAGSEGAPGDERAWYLSLHRSLDNLVTLHRRIETEWIPAMRRTAAELGAAPVRDLDDEALGKEVRRRWEINRRWVAVYWEDFIPFAHGMRLFGQVYNEVMSPDDPYSFMELLKHEDLISTRRNRRLAELAAEVRRRPERERLLRSGRLEELDREFRKNLQGFVSQYGDLSCPVTGAVACGPDARILANILIEMSAAPESSDTDPRPVRPDKLEHDFLAACPPDSLEECRRLLSLARASYRLRDDDNIILGAIEAQLIAVVQEARKRALDGCRPLADLMASLGIDAEEKTSAAEGDAPPAVIRDRQITGQPAGPGLGRGPARVIRRHADIARFKRGEVIVCDGVDPNMTFVMPLAAGIVERRGGMLIHGAIIAREYGLPCVTGVVDATRRIRTGQTVTVDGYLGIVTLGEAPGWRSDPDSGQAG